MVVPAPRQRTRFFGLIADSAKASPVALTNVNESIAAIHFGMTPAAPRAGRLRHCLAASSRSRAPSTSLMTDDTVDGVPSDELSAWPTRRRTTTVTMTMPATQPSRNPVLVVAGRRDSSIRMTAMIGIGLIATPIAKGSKSPMT